MKFHEGPKKVSVTDKDLYPWLSNPYITKRATRPQIKVYPWLRYITKRATRPQIKVEPVGNLKQKLILEGLASWASIGAWAVGSTLFVAGWATGSANTCFAGFSIFGGGFAWSITNLIWRYESIKSKVLGQIKEAERIANDQKLDDLDRKLTEDKDPRDQSVLRDLRMIYNEFNVFVEDGRIPEHVSFMIRTRINELFELCISNLQMCYSLWSTARTLRGKPRKQLLDNREEILQGVIKSVDDFTNVVTTVMTLSCKNGELAGVSDKLDSELAACLKVDQRLKDLTVPSYEDFVT